MNDQEIQARVLAALGQVAPEADLATLDPTVNIREQLDVDSMDFLTFVMELDRELGVDVPEADYGKIATLDGCVAYVRARLSMQSPTPG
jgi:acyl carrier protein